jgi:thioesterase III
MSSAPTEVVFHIYPSDCDMLGHLNHASMLAFMERARWTWVDERMILADVANLPVLEVVRHVNIGYRMRALPGDDLIVRSGVREVGNTSYTIHQEAYKLDTGELVAEADVVIVAINREGTPVPVPAGRKTSLPRWPREA